MNRFPYPQSVKTLRSTCGAMLGPASSNSSLVIHMDWKVAKEERMDPPIHTEYLRSGGATTLIFMVGGARATISLVRRSWMPGYMVEPPDMTTLPYKSLRMSTSHFMMVLYVVSWTPAASLPIRDGSKSTSGQRNRWLATLRVRPSGSSYIFSPSEDSSNFFIPC